MNQNKDTKKKTVLVLMAHPDDAEFLCAGTLVLLANRGWDVHIASSTPGDLGSQTLAPKEIAAIRRKEGAAAAAVIGAHYHCLELSDLRVFYNEHGLRKATSMLRKTQPDLVITHSPADYMLDHEETSKLARAACFAAPVPHAVVEEGDSSPPLKRIPALYYADAVEGVDPFGNRIEVSLAVDTTDVFDRKLDMLRCHASQREWLRSQHGMDEYLETCRAYSEMRGKEFGFKHAEGFRQHMGHGYPHNNLLLEVLGDVARPV